MPSRSAAGWRFFDALLEDIARREYSVHFETFLWKEGVLGHALGRCAHRAAPRRRAGTRAGRRRWRQEDGRGCGAPQLREAGCQLEMHHPRHAAQHWRLQRPRPPQTCGDRRRVALVGGHCIVDGWLCEAQDRDNVRDTRRAAARPGGARGAVGFQRELGGGHRRAVRRRCRYSRRSQPMGDVAVARREHQARGFSAGGEDPSPHR